MSIRVYDLTTPTTDDIEGPRRVDTTGVSIPGFSDADPTCQTRLYFETSDACSSNPQITIHNGGDGVTVSFSDLLAAVMEFSVYSDGEKVQ